MGDSYPTSRSGQMLPLLVIFPSLFAQGRRTPPLRPSVRGRRITCGEGCVVEDRHKDFRTNHQVKNNLFIKGVTECVSLDESKD